MSERPLVIDAYSRVIDSQQETIAVQRELLGMSRELDRARQQVVESTRLELRAAQVVAVLRIALLKLAGVVTDLADERAFARASIDRAQEERARATALADDALELIAALDERAGEVEVLEEAPLITVDAVMDDLTAALDRVRQILDDQDSDLDRLESEASPAAAAERLFKQYVDAPMPVAILDADGYFVRINEPFSKSLGYAIEDLVRMRMSEIAKPWTCDDDEHLVLPAQEGVEWYRVRRWTVSNCQIAVFHDDWERTSGWLHTDTFLPNKAWLKMWCEEHVLGFGQVGACVVHFDLGSLVRDVRWPRDHLVPLARRMFRLMSEGNVIVQLADDVFMFIVDGNRVSLDEFLAGVRPALEKIGEELPFAVGAAECRSVGSRFEDEILYDVSTAGLWATVHRYERPRVVRAPTFAETPEASPAGPLSYRTCLTAGKYMTFRDVRVVGPLSLPVFQQALADLNAWREEGFSLTLEFVVLGDELRLHDWSAEFGSWSSVANHTRILFDGDPGFDDYVLLRRYGRKAQAGVVSADEQVLERARQLKLSTSGSAVLDAEPVDAQGVRAWLSSRP